MMKEFCLRISAKEKYSYRELKSQMASAYFERTMLSKEIVSAPLTQFKENNISEGIFKDTYLFEFLDLPANYSEKDLKKGLIEHLKSFISHKK